MNIQLELILDSGASITITGEDMLPEDAGAFFAGLAAFLDIEWEDTE